MASFIIYVFIITHIFLKYSNFVTKKGDIMNNIFSKVFPFWGTLSNEQQINFAKSTKETLIKKGQRISGPEGNCTGLYIIIQGQLRAFINSETGREVTLYRLFDNDVCLMSASCMMKGLTYSISIEAMQDTQAVLIPPKVYKALSASMLCVSEHTQNLMAQHLQDILWIMEQVLFSSLDKRVAALLIEECTIKQSNTLTITHDEIARHLGSAREVITRMLKYFASEGLVEILRGSIIIKDMKSLKLLCS